MIRKYIIVIQGKEQSAVMNDCDDEKLYGVWSISQIMCVKLSIFYKVAIGLLGSFVVVVDGFVWPGQVTQTGVYKMHLSFGE